MAKQQTKRKRVVVIADLHCGHAVGLTPPAWWWRKDTESQAKVCAKQKELWNFYAKTLDALKPIDILIANGDLIDGKGLRSGGREQNTANRLAQCEMACICLQYAKAKKYLIIYGTAYHTGHDEDWEAVAAEMLEADYVKVEGHAFPNINGVQFDIKHHIGGAGVPHGRYTALAREHLWNVVWQNRDEQQPKSGVLIRSHVHCHAYCGNASFLAMTTPALQGYGSIYGVRRCSGTVDIGLIHFDIEPNGDYTWRCHTSRLKQQTVKTLRL